MLPIPPFSSVLVLIFLVFAPAAMASADLDRTVAELQQTYAGIDSLSFTFTQSTSGPVTGRARAGSGTAAFAKTGGRTLMRWNYARPDFQVVISDGRTVSMYFEKLNQLIVTSADAVRTDVLFSFFTGTEPLERYFEILPPELEMDIDAARELSGLRVVQLQPRDDDTQVRSIHLWVGPDSLIRRIEMVDFFDTRTTLNLANIDIDPFAALDEEDLARRFSFEPPEGTEIIRQ